MTKKAYSHRHLRTAILPPPHGGKTLIDHELLQIHILLVCDDRDALVGLLHWCCRRNWPSAWPLARQSCTYNTPTHTCNAARACPSRARAETPQGRGSVRACACPRACVFTVTDRERRWRQTQAHTGLDLRALGGVEENNPQVRHGRRVRLVLRQGHVGVLVRSIVIHLCSNLRHAIHHNHQALLPRRLLPRPLPPFPPVLFPFARPRARAPPTSRPSASCQLKPESMGR